MGFFMHRIFVSVYYKGLEKFNKKDKIYNDNFRNTIYKIAEL